MAPGDGVAGGHRPHHVCQAPTRDCGSASRTWSVLPSPLLPSPAGQPYHSTPYQALPVVYVQNASLEIAWTRVVFEQKTIAGDVIVPFMTEGHEGFDINDPYDWLVAERLIADGAAVLPAVPQAPYGLVRA